MTSMVRMMSVKSGSFLFLFTLVLLFLSNFRSSARFERELDGWKVCLLTIFTTPHSGEQEAKKRQKFGKGGFSCRRIAPSALSVGENVVTGYGLSENVDDR